MYVYGALLTAGHGEAFGSVHFHRRLFAAPDSAARMPTRTCTHTHTHLNHLNPSLIPPAVYRCIGRFGDVHSAKEIPSEQNTR